MFAPNRPFLTQTNQTYSFLLARKGHFTIFGMLISTRCEDALNMHVAGYRLPDFAWPGLPQDFAHFLASALQ